MPGAGLGGGGQPNLGNAWILGASGMASHPLHNLYFKKEKWPETYESIVLCAHVHIHPPSHAGMMQSQRSP